MSYLYCSPRVSMLLFAVVCLSGCAKLDQSLLPGTFNRSTIIVDEKGNSVDIAGDWAVFRNPGASQFTHYLHYNQESEIAYSVLDNEVFMLEYDQGRASLPKYNNGRVDKPRSLFLQRNIRKVLFLDGKIHSDYRDYPLLYNKLYGEPDLVVILDKNTLTYEDLPNVRLRRISTFN